jgi:hypothetical protein
VLFLIIQLLATLPTLKEVGNGFFDKEGGTPPRIR